MRQNKKKRSVNRPPRRKKESMVPKEKPSFSERFCAFMRNLNDPARHRKRNLPPVSDFPEGQVPLWVSDPDHYVKKPSFARRLFGAMGRGIVNVFLICCVVGVVCLGMAAAIVYSYSDPDLDERFASMDLDYSSFIYATDPTTGETYVYQEIQSTSASRIWVPLEDIPQYVQDATIAIEDKRFHFHMGVDPIRLTKAVILYAVDLLSGGDGVVEGGSTLTQQLIKNITDDDEQDWTRKVREVLRALYIERRYTKDQILEYYLNTVYFGSRANGIAAAAEKYFGKDASELTVVEGAAIVAITKSPTYYDPFLYPEHNEDRREDILWYMYQQNYITEAEFQLYIRTDLDLLTEDDKKAETESGVFLYDYYTDMVINDVLADLQAAGYTPNEASRLLYRGGLRIYACVDPQIQSFMAEYFSDEEHFKYEGSVADFIVNDKGEVEHPQVAMMVLDPDTGSILGVIGGRGVKDKSLSLNRATDSLRQPGSSIKPLSVYGIALEQNLITLGMPVDDVPVETTAPTDSNKNGTKWPSNYDGTYSGLVSVKKALSWSLNTPSAKILRDVVGIANAYEFMINSLHFTSLKEDDGKYLSPLSVGGLAEGVTLREMVSAYTVYAGDGMYAKARSYSHVIGFDGKTVLENSVNRETVFSEQTAYLMTDILAAAVTVGSSEEANMKPIATAGKSGTTSYYKDRWFIGYTPDFLGGIWWGYDTPNTLENTHHVKMWNEVMTEIHHMRGITESSFDRPSGIVSCSVCWKSGKLPGPYCSTDPQGSCIQTFYYKDGTQPTETCSVHHQLKVCTVSGKIAHDNCPSVTLKTFVDVQRSFLCEVKVKDSVYVCPRLTPNDILYASKSLPVYTYMVPDGEYPAMPYYSTRPNTLCDKHQAPEIPYYHSEHRNPSTDSSQSTNSGT